MVESRCESPRQNKELPVVRGNIRLRTHLFPALRVTPGDVRTLGGESLTKSYRGPQPSLPPSSHIDWTAGRGAGVPAAPLLPLNANTQYERPRLRHPVWDQSQWVCYE